MLSTFKPVLEKPLKPVAKILKDVNPNAISAAGIVVPVLFFVAIGAEMYSWALILLALSSLDMLDGMVARANDKVTAFGGFLDSTIDRFADFMMLVAFGFAGLVAWEVVLPLLLATYLISYMRARIELAAKGNIVANVGIIERGERLAILFIGLLIYIVFPSASLLSHNVLTLVFDLLIILSVITIGQRFVFAYKHL